MNTLSRSGPEILGEGELGWFLLEQIEDALIRIADNVELKPNHLGVFSRSIARTLFDIGITAEGIMKKIVNDDALDKDAHLHEALQKARRTAYPFPNISDYRCVLEPTFNLSKRYVMFRHFSYSRVLTPFSSFADSAPTWWRIYVESKHDFLNPDKIDQATLDQVLNGLAGVFLLTVLCRRYWPALILNHKIVIGRITGSTYQDTGMNMEDLYRELHEAIFPSLEIVPRQRIPVGLLQGDILANSRLFFCALAQLTNDNRYEIPSPPPQR